MAARRASSVIDRSPASRSSRSCVSNAGAMTVRCTVIGSRADRRRSTRWYISTGTPRAAEGGPTRGVDPREAGPAPTASAAAQATATALRTRSAGPKPAHRPVDRIEHGPDHGLPGIVVDDGRAAEQLLFRSRPGDDGNRDPVQAERGDGGQRKAKDAVGAQVGLDREESGLAHDLQSLSRAAGAGHGAFVHQDRKSTRLNSSHVKISHAVFCLKKKKKST